MLEETEDQRLAKWADGSGMWSDYPPKLLHCYADWLQHASPTDWHRAAQAYNWTYGIVPMQWLVSQPDCELGTAVFLYYQSFPEDYAEWTLETVPERYEEMVRLLTIIRFRVAAGDYRRREIAFNPEQGFAKGLRLAPLESVPPILPGTFVPRPLDWNDGFPDEVWEAASQD